MGLDISHDAWHGAYSAFMRWREKVAEVGGFPPLREMAGYYKQGGDIFGVSTHFDTPPGDDGLPRSWEPFAENPLTVLLLHSDCDGSIPVEYLMPLAKALTGLLPALETAGDGGGHVGLYAEKTRTFIDGCLDAYAKGEALVFE